MKRYTYIVLAILLSLGSFVANTHIHPLNHKTTCPNYHTDHKTIWLHHHINKVEDKNHHQIEHEECFICIHKHISDSTTIFEFNTPILNLSPLAVDFQYNRSDPYTGKLTNLARAPPLYILS
jgi:ABC-type nickel/cobalt efflux system permease component RcnA